MQVVVSGRPRRSEPSLRLSILCAMSLPRAVEEKERAMRGRDRQLADSGLRKHNHGTEHGGELAALGGGKGLNNFCSGGMSLAASANPGFFEKPFTKTSIQYSFYHLNLEA
jgi:hypothetical protein